MTFPQVAPIPVRSSLLASISYSANTTLDLEFRSGALYRYFGVPHAIFAGLIAAESTGTFFNRNIRSHFAYRRLA